MHGDQLVARYLAALEAADLQQVLSLFAPDAVVESPLYGTVTAADFYPQLFADTAASRLTLKAVMTGEGPDGAVVSFWFDFGWTLVDGSPAPFSVIDLAEIGADGRITRLHIVYDTADIRGRFDALRDARIGLASEGTA